MIQGTGIHIQLDNGLIYNEWGARNSFSFHGGGGFAKNN